MDPESNVAIAEAFPYQPFAPCIVTPGHSYGGDGILESQDVTSDTELLAVADTLLSIGSQLST